MTEMDPRWIDDRAIAFALGELDDDDEARFRELVANDPDFSDLLAAGEDTGHVPAALIARWGADGRALSDTERSLVEAHLRWCPHCREELQLVGSPLAEANIVSPRFGWRPWIGGSVLGAAAMAAYMMFATPPAPSLQGEHLEVVTPRAVRGGALSTIGLSADTRAFLLAVALPTDVEPGAGAELVLLGPDGEEILRTPVGDAPWQPPSAQVLVLANPRFETGAYIARLFVRGEDGPRELGRFTVERP